MLSLGSKCLNEVLEMKFSECLSNDNLKANVGGLGHDFVLNNWFLVMLEFNYIVCQKLMNFVVRLSSSNNHSLSKIELTSLNTWLELLNYIIISISCCCMMDLSL